MAKRRPSGDGMVRQKKRGQWEARIVVGHKSYGKRKKFNVYAETRDQCEAKLAEMVTEKKAEIAHEKAKLKEGAS